MQSKKKMKSLILNLHGGYYHSPGSTLQIFNSAFFEKSLEVKGCTGVTFVLRDVSQGGSSL